MVHAKVERVAGAGFVARRGALLHIIHEERESVFGETPRWTPA